MAKGADLVVGGGCPPHMVYVRVAPDLKARSWGWSQTWHSAFMQTVSRIRQDVTKCVLNGFPMICEARVLPLPAGAFIELHVICSGTQIVIHVLDYVGPHDPGPDGGTWQPQPVDGSAHGAYGTGSELRLVAFYGPMPGTRPVDILYQLANHPCGKSAGMPRLCASYSSGRPGTKTMVWMPKELTSAPAARVGEGRNGQHNAIYPNSLLPAGGMLERLPAMRSRRNRAGIVDIADLRPGAPWLSSSTRTFMSEQGFYSVIRTFKASRVGAAGSPLRVRSSFDFDTDKFWSATHSRHLPQQLPSDPIGLSPGRASEPQLH
jgi:hypothetical protein